MVLASFPSPSQGVWHLGPFPVRGYALCIVVGIIVAIAVGERRVVARGGTRGMVTDVAFWAVPFGIVGGRLYHVITTPEPYFGAGGHPLRAFAIWEGGLGIWGAIALGAAVFFVALRGRPREVITRGPAAPPAAAGERPADAQVSAPSPDRGPA